MSAPEQRCWSPGLIAAHTHTHTQYLGAKEAIHAPPPPPPPPRTACLPKSIQKCVFPTMNISSADDIDPFDSLNFHESRLGLHTPAQVLSPYFMISCRQTWSGDHYINASDIALCPHSITPLEGSAPDFSPLGNGSVGAACPGSPRCQRRVAAGAQCSIPLVDSILCSNGVSCGLVGPRHIPWAIALE